MSFFCSGLNFLEEVFGRRSVVGLGAGVSASSGREIGASSFAFLDLLIIDVFCSKLVDVSEGVSRSSLIC